MTESVAAISSLAVHLQSSFANQCEQLAQQLQLPLCAAPWPDCAYAYVLIVDEHGIALQKTTRNSGAVRVEFDAGGLAYRRNSGAGELIVKAAGGTKNQRPSVLDVTAGLGRDSFVLACAGYTVTMLERSALVSHLLRDGLRRAAASADPALREVIGKMQLHSVDALDYMRSLPHEQAPDVIIIDPMFPASNKSALVKKDMQAFHALVGADSDSDQLLEQALLLARHRVVVKRPRKAECLAARKPSYAVLGKAIRFDIYALKTLGK